MGNLERKWLLESLMLPPLWIIYYLEKNLWLPRNLEEVLIQELFRLQKTKELDLEQIQEHKEIQQLLNMRAHK